MVLNEIIKESVQKGLVKDCFGKFKILYFIKKNYTKIEVTMCSNRLCCSLFLEITRNISVSLKKLFCAKKFNRDMY